VKHLNLRSSTINWIKSLFKKRRTKYIIVLTLLFFWFWFSLPKHLFIAPSCTVLDDNSGQLLGARIADDGQWRFPFHNEIPQKFTKAIIQYEDKYFYHHLGVNPVSMIRALIIDIKARRIVSGGSTLSMQLARLSRKRRSRSLWGKIVEVFMALRIECSYSKKEILAMYASNAPFGGNVVGLEAASWRYFGRSSFQLSWAESATLAVLPNSPALIYPGKNQLLLKRKRDRLLDHLRNAGAIDSVSCALAKSEALPGKPYPLPRIAPHLLTRVYNDGLKGKWITSTIDKRLQQHMMNVVEHHHALLKENQINNAAALVLDVETGNVLAYVGNTENPNHPEHGGDVDVITAPRSTGSILKPFLFAAMLNEGEILPATLVPDIPTQIAEYAPKNYNLTFDGAVPAKRALARSLNIPAVRMLHEFKVERFHYLLKKVGMSTLTFPPDHYGLSLILGGAEGSLWDLCGMYASMARTLNHFGGFSGKYLVSDFHPPYYISPDKKNKKEKIIYDESSCLNASSIWLTFEAMVEVSRPDEESAWNEYVSAGRIAWKTGTSFGFRDGWAIGCTPRYIVGVWTGNANGEGRPGLTGIATAAPIMFDIFDQIKSSDWFDQPYDEMVRIPVCKESGYRASDICENKDSVWIPLAGMKTLPCPYHRIIHLDAGGQWRVNDQCERINTMIHRSWFVLPPVMEWYYKSKNPSYKMLPPFRSDCETAIVIRSMDLIYPRQFSKIYVPVEIDGTPGKAVFEAAHRNPDETIYWHLDKEFIGSTRKFHQMAVNPSVGEHLITLVDEKGETLEHRFEVIKK
jgi:penicillin-binding protein 1C